ncbi:tannase/feruloyl esterase family alpha/beta hydrolase [Kibdelosporangium philippinense]|uniref:Tannase/feruloyl esterase family alpha/beta hydrolase n=1 Tax=Kibdelosporangium philippinense TaxID=211113 RepID=A0ABS8ZTK2_9PSEU|nr:tannase/feruloyl esterase family alpha/beta hydrolase [Kibdelosporangium philippinense]MCE7011048.1 tannase/feruloyl esterase family alpha/beta hydrolase [Kibdelosporangium philippinense]
MRILLVLALLTVTPAAAHASTCAPVAVPGAAYAKQSCLDDLTTTGTLRTGHTVQADWAGLTSAGFPLVSAVPGIQVDGYFPDTSKTNTTHGWNHDSKFVLRLPSRWNGGLVVSGSPGVRRQYANDRAIGDQAIASGHAFAATDKGNTGADFFTDGHRPADALVEWNMRVTQLTVASKLALALHYGRSPNRTIVAGISNGGYLVRWQLENAPWLYDGGVDWEGTLWNQDDNLLTFLPPAIRGEPLAAGFDPASEFLWLYHKQVYWDLTQRIYRTELDPSYNGPEADYDYASRPRAVHQAVSRISLTGRIGKPLLTLHGTLDALLPISRDSDVYNQMIASQGRAHLQRYYRIEGGNHVDGLYDAYPDLLRPIAPCFTTAFHALEDWLKGAQPPPSATIPRPTGTDLATTCALK